MKTIDDFTFELNGRIRVMEEKALAFLLEEEVLFCNCWPYGYWEKENGDLIKSGETVVLFVDCSDVFMWAMAEGEDLQLSEIHSLLEHYLDDKQWGVVKWVCKKRQMQPQFPIIKDMKEAGSWTEDMEKLPKNTYDG